AHNRPAQLHTCTSNWPVPASQCPDTRSTSGHAYATARAVAASAHATHDKGVSPTASVAWPVGSYAIRGILCSPRGPVRPRARRLLAQTRQVPGSLTAPGTCRTGGVSDGT